MNEFLSQERFIDALYARYCRNWDDRQRFQTEIANLVKSGCTCGSGALCANCQFRSYAVRRINECTESLRAMVG